MPRAIDTKRLQLVGQAPPREHMDRALRSRIAYTIDCILHNFGKLLDESIPAFTAKM